MINRHASLQQAARNLEGENDLLESYLNEAEHLK